jgi:DNA invertase Pin-like site-specific DNA recombinase
VPGRGVIEVQSATGFLTTSMEGTIAEHYRRLCGERTRAALAHLRSQRRRWTRLPPFGQRWTQVGGVEPDPAEAAVVGTARVLRAEGLSLRRISAELAAKGMFSRAGTPLDPKTVASMVRTAQS